MLNGKLYFTIGMPRSGKSTYCNKWAAEKPNRVIVSSDDIRFALHGKRYEPLAETMVFAIKHIMTRAHLNRGNDVIVDGTHSTRLSIQRLLEIDRLAVAVTIETPADECIRRAIATNQEDLIPVISRIDAQIQYLNSIGLQECMIDIVDEIEKRGLF